MPFILLFALFALAPLPAGAQSGSQSDCSVPLAADGWQVAAPAAVGLDPATLCGIGPRFKAWTAANVHSVLVVRHGKLVYEQYFTTADQVAGYAKEPLTIPAVGFGGEACLGGLTLATVQAVAPGATGGVIERAGHWMAEEQPDAVIDIVLALSR